MGLVLSTCRRQKRSKIITIIHDKYTQTTNTLPHMRNNSSYRCYHNMSSRQQRQRRFIAPLRSTAFDKPSSDKSNIPPRRSHPYVAKAFNRIIDRTDPSRVSSISNIHNNTSHHEYQTSTQVKSFSTEQSKKQNIGDRSRLLERSTSIPINTFLIDISNEQVPVGQPVSMHIRHLLVTAPQDNPLFTKPVSTTTGVHEDLLQNISNVCKNYPNLTADPDQPTHTTLHALLPSQLPHTMA